MPLWGGQAILDGSIQPCYQPFSELKTDRIAGFELLAKWHHAELGEVPPERFLPVAESCGLAMQLGEHLLRMAAREALRWPDDMILSYNTSLTQLRNQSFGLRVLSILAKTGLSPQRLEIEITESALVRDTDTVHTALQGLRDAGVRIALDDFGTGYSSLYHLRMLKFDRIKIDRSFVASMSRDQESAAIIKALLGLGHGLGIKTVVEGVETPQQREALIEEGCDQEQGVLPQALDAAGVESLLRGARVAEKIEIPQSA